MLSLDEIRTWVFARGGTEDHVLEMMERLDTNKDAHIDRAEFAVLRQDMERKILQEVRNRIKRHSVHVPTPAALVQLESASMSTTAVAAFEARIRALEARLGHADSAASVGSAMASGSSSEGSARSSADALLAELDKKLTHFEDENRRRVAEVERLVAALVGGAATS